MTLIIAAKNKEAIAVVSDRGIIKYKEKNTKEYSWLQHYSLLAEGKTEQSQQAKIIPLFSNNAFFAYAGKTHKDNNSVILEHLNFLQESSDNFLNFTSGDSIDNFVNRMKEFIGTEVYNTKHLFMKSNNGEDIQMPFQLLMGIYSANKGPVLLGSAKTIGDKPVREANVVSFGSGNVFLRENEIEEWYKPSISTEELCYHLGIMLLTAQYREKLFLEEMWPNQNHAPLLVGQDLGLLTKDGFIRGQDMQKNPKYDNLLSNLLSKGFDFSNIQKIESNQK